MKIISNFEKFNEHHLSEIPEFIEPFQEKLEILESELENFYPGEIRVRGNQEEIRIHLDQSELKYNLKNKETVVIHAIDLDLDTLEEVINYVKKHL